MNDQSNLPAPHYANVQMQPFGNAALPALQSLADVVSIAQLMAKSQMAVPKHLRENPGACLAVTMQALRWNADPFAVANKSYYVNDRMAYEAQMFAAVINTMAPIKGRPRYSYQGEGPERVCIVEVTTKEGEVIEQHSPKFKDIQPKNSPLWKSDPDQQLGYYTIRTMARRHFPDVVLGIYDPDEMESIGPERIEPKKEDLVGKLSASVGDDGFNRERVEAEVQDTGSEPKPKRTRKPKDEPEEAMHAQAEPPAPVEPETAPDTPEPPEAAPAPLEGHAGPGEVYLLAGEGFVMGSRPTYKDGGFFSSVKTPAGAAKLPEYAEHSPEVVDVLDGDGIPEHMLDPDAPATVEEAQDEEPPEPEEAPPPELAPYIAVIEKEGANFGDVKTAIKELMATDFWKGLDGSQQNRIRATTWEVIAEWFPPDRPDPFTDVSAFRLWVEHQDDPDALVDGLSRLESSPEFAGKPDGLKEALRGATQARLNALEEEVV